MYYSFKNNRYTFFYVDRKFIYKPEEVHQSSLLFINEELVQINEFDFVNIEYIESILVQPLLKVIMSNGTTMPVEMNQNLLNKI